jgi:regulator of protease activity HflC (stomatin/prohibitin superfamily)
VRTSDNVKLTLEGAIFWQIKNLSTVIIATADPEGDVWHHARSALIEAVSGVTLQTFMAGFNDIVMQAFGTTRNDGFYAERGVEIESMELTRFDCADPETSQILQAIIQETTNRINKLTVQESANEVAAAALTAEIALEQQKTELIRTQSENQVLQSKMEGEANGQEIVGNALAFIGGLNETVPDVNTRVELYTMHHQLDARNTDTQNLASGTAHLFVTPADLNLKLNMDSNQASPLEL